MDRTAAQALLTRLAELIREQWCVQDPEAQVSGTLRADNKIDMTVVSRLFEGKDSLEREACFGPVFDTVPRSERIYMTYCLLVTPEEARRLMGDQDGRTFAPDTQS